MTKEIYFLEKQGYEFDKDKDLLFMEDFFSSEHKVKDICNLLKEYADQQTESLKAELSELKERHKRDVMDFGDFIALKGYTLIQKNNSENGAMFFFNKASIGVSTYEVYQQYYKQKFESND